MKKQGHDRTAIAERAKAARRAAQLRKEAEERASAREKIEQGQDLTKNDVLALLGSAFRLPEPEPFTPQDAASVKIKEMYDSAPADVQEMLAGLFFMDEEPYDPEYEEAPAAVPPTDKKRRSKPEDYPFTAEEIVRLRDEVGLSWRQVAVNLDLGSPGAARKAYTTLTGRDFKESAMTGRRTRTAMGTAKGNTRKVYAPLWDDESDQDEIIERLTHSRAIIQREVKGILSEEDIMVGRVIRLSWDGKNEDGPLTVHFTDKGTGGRRSVRVSDIKEVR